MIKQLDSPEALQKRLDAATTRLLHAAQLINELAAMSKTRPIGFPQAEFAKAIDYAAENFGCAAGEYNDLTEEINITLRTDEGMEDEEE